MKDSLQSIQDTIKSTIADVSNQIHTLDDNSFNWWMIIALIELLLIIILIIRHNKSQKINLARNDGFDELRRAKTKDIDMANLMNSINLSKDLFKDLSKKCHPDKFHDNDIKVKAEILFQEISKNKRNYSKLLELKKKAIKDLNINF